MMTLNMSDDEFAELFVRVWESSRSRRQVSSVLGMPMEDVRFTEDMYRDAGVRLKPMAGVVSQVAGRLLANSS